MSVESRVARAAAVTTAIIASSAVIAAREYLKRIDRKKDREFIEQSAGDSGILFKRETRLR